MLDSLAKQKWKHVDSLQERVTLMDHCKTLGACKIATVNKAELIANLAVLNASGFSLPFSMRLQAFVRFREECMSDLLDAKNKQQSVNTIDEMAAAFAVWADGRPEVSDVKLRLSDIWHGRVGELRGAVKKGKMSQAESEEQLSKDAEAGS